MRRRDHFPCSSPSLPAVWFVVVSLFLPRRSSAARYAECRFAALLRVLAFELALHVFDREADGTINGCPGLVAYQMTTQRTESDAQVGFDPSGFDKLTQGKLGNRVGVVNEATFESGELSAKPRFFNLAQLEILIAEHNR